MILKLGDWKFRVDVDATDERTRRYSYDHCQCGYCKKCVRTQLNILCAGENPKDWGFDDFSEKEFSELTSIYEESVSFCVDMIHSLLAQDNTNNLTIADLGFVNYTPNITV